MGRLPRAREGGRWPGGPPRRAACQSLGFLTHLPPGLLLQRCRGPEHLLACRLRRRRRHGRRRLPSRLLLQLGRGRGRLLASRLRRRRRRGRGRLPSRLLLLLGRGPAGSRLHLLGCLGNQQPCAVREARQLGGQGLLLRAPGDGIGFLADLHQGGARLLQAAQPQVRAGGGEQRAGAAQVRARPAPAAALGALAGQRQRQGDAVRRLLQLRARLLHRLVARRALDALRR